MSYEFKKNNPLNQGMLSIMISRWETYWFPPALASVSVRLSGYRVPCITQSARTGTFAFIF